jgi:hypothetical protein
MLKVDAHAPDETQTTDKDLSSTGIAVLVVVWAAFLYVHVVSTYGVYRCMKDGCMLPVCDTNGLMRASCLDQGSCDGMTCSRMEMLPTSCSYTCHYTVSRLGYRGPLPAGDKGELIEPAQRVYSGPYPTSVCNAAVIGSFMGLMLTLVATMVFYPEVARYMGWIASHRTTPVSRAYISSPPPYRP